MVPKPTIWPLSLIPKRCAENPAGSAAVEYRIEIGHDPTGIDEGMSGRSEAPDNSSRVVDGSRGAVSQERAEIRHDSARIAEGVCRSIPRYSGSADDGSGGVDAVSVAG